jgi:hypothetical protein
LRPPAAGKIAQKARYRGIEVDYRAQLFELRLSYSASAISGVANFSAKIFRGLAFSRYASPVFSSAEGRWSKGRCTSATRPPVGAKRVNSADPSDQKMIAQ